MFSGVSQARCVRKRSSGVPVRPSTLTAVLVAAIFVLAALAPASASAAVEHKFEKAIVQFETEPGKFEALVHPWGLAFGAEGNLFAADPGEEGIGPSNLDVFGAAGGSIARVGALAGGYTRSVAVSAATGDVYVADSGCDCVRVFDPMMKGDPALGYVELEPWTGKDTTATSFGSAFVYVAVNNSSDAHAGDVYVMNTGNHVVDVIKPGESGGETEPVQELTSYFSEFGQVSGLAVSPVSGDVYLTTNIENDSVKVFNVNGEPQPDLEPRSSETPAKSFTPIGVTVAPATGEVYVVDSANHVVDEFSSGGEYEGQIADAKTGEPLLEPSGVAVSSSGQVYVSDGAAKAVDVYGAEPPVVPVVESDSVSQVTDDSATLNAEIDPRGRPGDPSTKYRFQYTTEERFEHEGFTGATGLPAPEGVLAPSFEVDSVSVPVQGLTAGTTYRFRVLVENGVGAAVQDTEHSFTTRTPGSFALPDGRQWEMVSPPQKEGVLIEPISGAGDDYPGAAVQASANGDGISYVTDAPTEAGAQGYSNFVQVLSLRSPDGWSSRDLPGPHAVSTGVSLSGQEYRLFSEDLSLAVLQPMGPFVPSLSPEASEQTTMLRTDYLNGDASEPCLPASMHCYRPLVTGKEGYANVPPGTVFGLQGGNPCEGAIYCGPEFVGGTPDLSHVVLSSPGPALTPGGPAGGLYEWNGGEPPAKQLKPVSILPPNNEGKELPTASGQIGSGSDNGKIEARHAISNDGSRVFWSGGGPDGGHLNMRDMVKEETLAIGGPSEDMFQAANSEGTTVFFTEGGSLFECAIGEEGGRLECDPPTGQATDLTPSGGVLGTIMGASEDGSWVYFVANSALAPSARAGSCPESTKSQAVTPNVVCNLYVRHGGVTRLVAVLSGNDSPDWGGEGFLKHLTARVSPDGKWLAFMSERSLTGYDNADAVSGRPDEEVYLYHAPADLATESGNLDCASCNPTGARPHGVESENDTGSGFSNIPLAAGSSETWTWPSWLAGNVPTWTASVKDDALYQSRYLSDSGRLFFNSSDALVPKDVNGTEDVYEYEPEGIKSPEGKVECSEGTSSGSDVFEPAGTVTLEEGTPGEHTVMQGAGCVALISDGANSEESAFLDASETGGDVFFLTKAKLAPQDTDDALDIYDAQECTSKEPCPSPAAQAPVACDNEASCKAPPSPQPAVFGLSGSATFSGPGNLAPPPVAVVKKVTKKTVKCKRGFVKNKKGKCVKKSKSKRRKAKKSNRRAK
jgi:DNA-binding beta-propeller fold protein YncE